MPKGLQLKCFSGKMAVALQLQGLWVEPSFMGVIRLLSISALPPVLVAHIFP